MKVLMVWVLGLGLSQPLSAATIVAEPFPPTQLTSLAIEKDEQGRSVTVQSNGDVVIYKVSQGGKELENLTDHPSGEDWFKFIQALNRAKVYKWASNYDYPGQGDRWLIDLTMEDRKFSSEGTNDYPLNGDEAKPQANPGSGPSIPFQLFWQAVLTLVGKAPPPAPK